jgi:hypothetical protein
LEIGYSFLQIASACHVKFVVKYLEIDESGFRPTLKS